MAETILAKLAVQIAANTAEFNKGLKQGSSDLKAFQGNVTKIAGAIGIAFGVKEVAGFAFEVSKLAGEAEGVRAAFERLPESQVLMERLKNATSDTVSELDLMKRSVQAANFGISLGALPKLLEFASIRAQQTGQSVDYLVDSIITGIGRKSPLILDNLGISAVALKDKMNGVSIATASVGEVADAVGKIASDSLSTMGSFSDNASTKVQKLNAAWENFKVVIGESANGTGVLGRALNTLTATLERLSGNTKRGVQDWSDSLARAISEGTTNVDNWIVKLQEFRRENGAPLQFNIDELIEKYKLTGDQADVLTNAIIKVNATLSDQERRIKIFNDFAKRNGYTDLAKAAEDFKNIQYQNILQAQIEQSQLEKYTPELTKNIEEQKVKVKVYRDLIAAVNEYVKSNTQEIAQVTEQLGLLERLNLQLKDLEEAKKKAFSAGEVAALNDQIKDLRAEIDLLNASTQRTSGFFKQLASGQKVNVPEFDLGQRPEGQTIPVTVDVQSPRIDATAEEIRSQFAKIQEARNADIEQSILWNDIQNEQFEKTKNSALEYGDAIGSALGNAIAGQESAANALKKISATIISTFLKQALAGIIASATKSGGPPPVVLGLAAAGVAAITAMFSKLGASGGGGAGTARASVSRAPTRADQGRLTNKGNEIAVGGEVVIRGEDLVYIINRNTQKSSRTRG